MLVHLLLTAMGDMLCPERWRLLQQSNAGNGALTKEGLQLCKLRQQASCESLLSRMGQVLLKAGSICNVDFSRERTTAGGGVPTHVVQHQPVPKNSESRL